MREDLKQHCKKQDEARYKEACDNLGIGTFEKKKKRKIFGWDEQFNDPLGIEKIKEDKHHEVFVSEKEGGVVDKYILQHGIKAIIGKKAWCVKSDKSKFYEGWVVDVLPPNYLLVKCNDENLPMRFDNVISIGEE